MTTRAELVHECARRIDCGHSSTRLSLAAATLDGDGELRERLTNMAATWRTRDSTWERAADELLALLREVL